VRRTPKKRVFVAFAMEDKWARDLLRGQALNTRSPFEYTDFSVKEPFSNAWKTEVRKRIRSCDGVIVLLSKNVRNANGARWEIKCAIEEGIPIRGVSIHKDDRYVPPEMNGKRLLRWTWDNIQNFIDKL
jgi:hypothetical protein